MKFQPYFALAAAMLAVADLVIGWLAVGHAGFAREYLVPIIAASLAGVIVLAGWPTRRPWVFGGGLVGVFVFCPSPFGLWPLLVGSILLTFYAASTYRKEHPHG